MAANVLKKYSVLHCAVFYVPSSVGYMGDGFYRAKDLQHHSKLIWGDKGQLSQRAGSLGLNGGGTAAVFIGANVTVISLCHIFLLSHRPCIYYVHRYQSLCAADNC